MFHKDIDKNTLFNRKHIIHKILVGYLISILAMGTVLPTVCSDSLSWYSDYNPPYVLSAVNQPPIFGTPTPGNGSANNPLTLTWSIPITDPEGDRFAWMIQCCNGQRNNSCNQTNGTKSLSLSGLAYSTMYKICVNATDPIGSGVYTRRWFTFTTQACGGNNPPMFGTPSPGNGSAGNLFSLSWGIPINDPEGNLFTWSIQCSNGQRTNGTGSSNGTKSLALSGLMNSAIYRVWVNATDPSGSGVYTRRWFTFATKENLTINNPPVFGVPSPSNGSTGNLLSLSWGIPINDPEGNLFTWSIQCSNGQRTNGSGASNGTKSLTLSGLAFVTSYTIWVNASDPSGSGLFTRKWFTFTTRANSPPVVGTPSPSNGSSGNLLVDLSWSIPINDPEGNPFSWTIQCSNNQVNSGTGSANGTKSLSLSGLSYATTYKVWVNATDPTGSGLYTRKWYTFTTKPLPPMKVIITKPLEGKLYIRDQERKNLSTNTIVYGPITITAEVTSEIDVDLV